MYAHANGLDPPFCFIITFLTCPCVTVMCVSFFYHLQNSLSIADGEISLGNSLLLIDWKCMGNLYWSDTAVNTLYKRKQSNKTICIMSKTKKRGKIDSSKQIYRHLSHPWCSVRQMRVWCRATPCRTEPHLFIDFHRLTFLFFKGNHVGLSQYFFSL